MAIPFTKNSKLMIVRLVDTTVFWMKDFPPSKPALGLSDIKGPRQLVLGTTVDYKKILRLYPVKCYQLHQYYEPRNTNDKYRTVGEIVLGPQYNI